MNATLSQGFAQDALHRVTTDAGSYGTKNYTYDGAGNRLTRTHGASSQTLTYATVSPPPGGGGSGGGPATGSPGTGGATLAVSATQVLPAGSVTATLTSGPGGSTDWLALAAVGAATTSYLQWRYVGSGVTTLNWTVTMPSSTGAYEFRLFLNNGYTLAATSPAVTVSTTPPEPVPWANGSNRLATHDGHTVTIDAAGSTLGDPTVSATFTVGSHQRMLEAYVGGVLKASYVYDGRGQRIKKIEATSPNRTIVYHYGQAGELLGETIYSSAGAKIGERDYLWLDTLPLAQSERTFSGGTLTGSTFVYLHADQLNTPRLATNASGTVVWRWDSDAFGVGTANQDPDGDTNLVNIRLRFPGQYLDEETGLHYNYFRDYDAATGRYVESDPIGLEGGINTYAYAAGNPVSMIDPDGLVFIDPWGRIPDDASGPGRPRDLNQDPDPCGCWARAALLGLAGGGLVGAGQPVPDSKPFRTPGSSVGTSPARRAADKVFGDRKFPRAVRTPVGGPGTGVPFRVARTRSVAGAAARWVPYVGWAMLAFDPFVFASCLAECDDDGCTK